MMMQGEQTNEQRQLVQQPFVQQKLTLARAAANKQRQAYQN